MNHITKPRHSMPVPKHASDDLKWYAVHRHVVLGESCRSVAASIHRHHTTVLDWVRNVKCFGMPSLQYHINSMKLGIVEVEYLRAMVQANPTIYLDELKDQLLDDMEVTVSASTLCRVLRDQLGFSRKKITTYNKKKSLLLQEVFWSDMEYLNVTPQQLVFLDETAKDVRDIARLYGR